MKVARVQAPVVYCVHASLHIITAVKVHINLLSGTFDVSMSVGNSC